MSKPRKTLIAIAVASVTCAVTTVLVATSVAASGTAQDASSRSASAVAECKGHDLVGFQLRSGAGLGNQMNLVGVVNVGTAPCRLAGYPGLEGIRSGHAHPLVVSGHGTYFGNLLPSVLAPRTVGALILGTEAGCDAINQPNQAAMKAEVAAHTYTGVVIRLPQHDGSVVANGVRFDTACGLSSSRLGWRSDL